jgi:hypothetical protein
MTLNITVAARWLMAQSSDFRLTKPDTGASLCETAQKQVVLQYRDWSGLVCYTGVARWQGGHDTAAWLGDVLTHEPGQRTPKQVVQRITDEGSVWLRKVPRAMRRHTFTMIAYVGSKSRVYVISNYERPNGPSLPTPADALFVTPVTPKGPRCIVTGWSPAVTARQRVDLEDLLASSPSPQLLRERVALTSRDAAPRAEGTVSDACVSAHLCPDGSGEAQVFGNLDAEFLPALITHGRSHTLDARAALQQAGRTTPHRLVGVTWERNHEATVMLPAYRAISNQAGSAWPDR